MVGNKATNHKRLSINCQLSLSGGPGIGTHPRWFNISWCIRKLPSCGNQDSENEVISNHQQENNHCYCFAALGKSNEVFHTTDKHDLYNLPFEVFAFQVIAPNHLAIDAERLYEGHVNSCCCYCCSNDQVIAAKKERIENHN